MSGASDAIKFLREKCGFGCGDPGSEISLAWKAIEEQSAAYDALVAEIARAPVGKVEVYDTPEQWRYVIVPDHFDSGQRVRLLVSDDRPSHTERSDAT